MTYKAFHISSKNYIPASMETGRAFQEQYIALRKKEQRLYADEQLRQLPDIDPAHPHYKEWLSRKRSANKLLQFTEGLKKPLTILEIGCGNGWLSHKLSLIPGIHVVGLDINEVELQQAVRVFGQQPNLQFVYDNNYLSKPSRLFDMIIFAASIQYFSSLPAVITNALQHLQPAGSIHIIDSHFYTPGVMAAARQRSLDYFASLGFPGLSAYYFHHTIHELKSFQYKILYDPTTIRNKLNRNAHPFYWISIKK